MDPVLKSLISRLSKYKNTWSKHWKQLQGDLLALHNGWRPAILLDYIPFRSANDVQEFLDIIDKSHQLVKAIIVNNDAVHILNRYMISHLTLHRYWIDVGKSFGVPKLLDAAPIDVSLIDWQSDDLVQHVNTKFPQDLVAWNGYLLGYPIVYCLSSVDMDNCLEGIDMHLFTLMKCPSEDVLLSFSCPDNVLLEIEKTPTMPFREHFEQQYQQMIAYQPSNTSIKVIQSSFFSCSKLIL